MKNLKGNKSFKTIALCGAILTSLISYGCHQPGHGIDFGGMANNSNNSTSLGKLDVPNILTVLSNRSVRRKES